MKAAKAMRKKTFTQDDVARRAGVSQAVVSAVLGGRTGKIGASEKLQKKILAAAAKLGYRTDSSARAMRMRRFYNLGYFTANVAQAVEQDRAEFRAGVYDTAAALGYHVTMVRLPSRPTAATNPIPQVFREAHLDGLIINHVSLLTPELQKVVAATGLPVVYLNEKLRHNSIYVDDFAGARIMTEHLLEQGYRRVAFSCTEAGAHYSHADRIAGYSKVMAGHRLPVRVLNTDTRRCGADILDWLRSTQRPDAVFCSTDFQALYFQRFIHQLGLHFPDDLGLAGYNNDGYDLFLESPLTTMSIPRYEMGKAAVEMVLKLIAAPEQPKMPSVCFMPGLVTGLSTQRGASHTQRPLTPDRWPGSIM
jgi:DNA-binding LacI/PurR family transcriptional regulator